MFDLTIRDFDGEPRMRDLEIAEALGFEHLPEIRRLISRHIENIEGFGVCVTVTQTHGSKGGRPGAEYWLNEEQALFLCTRSEAKGAVALTKQMVMVFAAWRNGRLDDLPTVPGMPGRVMELHPDADVWRGIIREARMLFGKDRAKWMWRQSPLPHPPDFIGQDGVEPVSNEAVVLDFLRAKCVITGDKSDWLTTRELISAFDAWSLGANGPLGDRAFSSALRSVSLGYRDELTGASFSNGKRSVTGYRGIRLRGEVG